MKISQKSELKPIFRMMYYQAEQLLDNDKEVVIEVNEFKYRRSSEQNNYYWLYCTELSDFFNETIGGYGEFEVPYTKDIVHSIHKKLFGIKTTTKMNIQEFCDYIHKLQSYWCEKTKGQFMMSELPETYLLKKGYDLERNMR